MTQLETCPKCGQVADHPPAVRQGEGTGEWEGFGVTDIGWSCMGCGHEWGFELLGDQAPAEGPK